MKSNAVNRDKVHWEKIKKKCQCANRNQRKRVSTWTCVQDAVPIAYDFHGGFYCWDSTYKWQRPEPEYSDSIKNEWKRAFFFKGNAARQYWLPKSVLYVVC